MRFHRTCVIDGLLEHSPAEWMRTVPPESPRRVLERHPHYVLAAYLASGT